MSVVKKLELFVKQIGRSNRDETVPLRQTIIDCRIDYPEVILTGRVGFAVSQSTNLPS